jgi:2-polyprenyl-3-methyl-5-hydroxy-6-metoxy-1,4-benzoquinol methylase
VDNSKVVGTRLTDTASEGYTDRLRRLSGSRWKQIINVQAPYQWNLRRLALGKTLDIGCGIGRNWSSLGAGSVGTDHNEHSVAYCNEQGFEAYTPDTFFTKFSPETNSFDSFLIAHVFEHLTSEQDLGILTQYLPYLRSGGRVVIITPQEVGYASDASHVEFMPFDTVAGIVEKAGLKVEKYYSFPFPRPFGKVFKYNEFIFIAKKP